MMTSVETLKKKHRQDLAALPFDTKIAILIKMQKMAREMAIASGRMFKGTVWGEEKSSSFSSDFLPDNPKK
jgi:hypothetical protein